MNRVLVDSGIEWMGKIPNEWKKEKLKNLYNFEKGRNAALYTKEYIDEHKGSYPVYSGQTENNGVMGRIDSFDYCIPECIFTTTVGANVMTLKLLSGKFSLSQNCLIMQPKYESNNHFYYYLLQSLFEYEKSLVPSYMQPSLRIEDLKKYSFYIPSMKEQERIANYLDDKCFRIDKTIKDNNKTISLLEEYKTSAISNIIRKGLKDEPLKETGIPYIGKIPSSWKCVKFDRLFEITKRIAGTEGYDVLSITQNGIKIKDIESNEGQLAANYSNYQFVDIGDFAMNHMDLLTGWVDCSKYNGVTSPDYRVFKLKSDEIADKRYCLYYLQLCYKERIFYGFGQGVSNLGRWRLPKDEFLSTYIPLPKLEEQQQICNYLDKHISLINEVIEHRKKIIEKLEEYRKSLIYECVTGKKEV